MPHNSHFLCVASTVLPSVKKDCVYPVNIVIWELPCSVNITYYTCPAKLSDCCDHVTATLYYLEDYIHQWLKDKERRLHGTSSSMELQNVVGQPTDEVKLREDLSCMLSINGTAIQYVKEWLIQIRHAVRENKKYAIQKEQQIRWYIWVEL